jgi:hypothetical protein
MYHGLPAHAILRAINVGLNDRQIMQSRHPQLASNIVVAHLGSVWWISLSVTEIITYLYDGISKRQLV